MIAVIVIAVTVVVALIILGGAAWFAFDSDKRIRKFARSTDLVPGKPSRAPDDWATANTPEALLHRRIRYAIADVHQNPAIVRDEELIAGRDQLDDAVFALDDRLIAAAALAEDDRTPAFAEIEAAIVTLEKLPKKLWEAPKEQQRADLDRVAGELRKAG